MPFLAILFGAALIALGVTAYLAPEMLAGGNAKQPTALSPAAIGALLALCGVVSAAAPGARKHAMHGAAVLALFGVLGGFVPMMLRKFDFGQTAVLVGAGMTGLSLVFLVLCVNSFIQAKKARKLAAAV